jgi:hypothetical protein
MTAEMRLGNCREVLADLKGKVDLIFTSPQFNVGNQKQDRKDGFRNDRYGLHDPKSFGGVRDYADDLPEDEYQDQQAASLIFMSELMRPNGVTVYDHMARKRGGVLYLPTDWIRRPEVRAKIELREYPVIWVQNGTHKNGRDTLYHRTHDLYVLQKPGAKYPLDSTLAYRAEAPFEPSNVWHLPRENKKRTGNIHNTPFTEKLAEWVINAWSRPGDLVCDPYSGSGTTGAVAVRLGRRFVGAEIVERYHAFATARIERALANTEPLNDRDYGHELPWDDETIGEILPDLGDIRGIDWRQPMTKWPKQTVVSFVGAACRLIHERTS